MNTTGFAHMNITTKTGTSMTTSTTSTTSTSTVSTCQLTFGPTDIYTTSGSHVEQFVASDFNGDGLSDLAVGTNAFSTATDVFLANENGTFGRRMTYAVVDANALEWLTVADFNNDDHQDIFVMIYGENNSVCILFGNSSGIFGAMIILPVVLSYVNSPCSIAGDLNSDGHIDIVFTKSSTPCSMAVLLGYGNGTFAAEKIIPIGNDGCVLAIAIADFNNDDHQDIAVTIDIDFYVAILLGYGNESFKTPMTFSTGIYSFSYSMDVNDFNGDGYLDIIIANQGNYNIGVFLGMGDGSFGTQITTMIQHTNLVSQFAIGDFNGDGKMDVAGVWDVWSSVRLLSSSPTFVTVLVGYGNGSFGQQMIFPTGLASADYVITNDFNGDHRLDLAIGNFFGGNIKVEFLAEIHFSCSLAKAEFKGIFHHDTMKNVPLIIIANKQDYTDALTSDILIEKLDLN
ncbi:unnamed protein product [Adineta steineri]|uniref:Uncharacterized protein n=1 Tax=Adineta steineri TaxID=433720 RepID=A0A816B8T7_9BILA|nr:unnamed protein product [Adineta steineri]CAF1606973.1 unnamed protein product [Adineta steineri]